MSDEGASLEDDPVLNPQYYVLDDRHADPATVVAGPLDADAAQRTASIQTPSGDVMLSAALIYSIREHDYNVQWWEDVDPPESLTVFDDEVVTDA